MVDVVDALTAIYLLICVLTVKTFRQPKGEESASSIRANRQLELRVVAELCQLFPVSKIVYEYVKAKTKKGCSFSPVQVGQKWAIEQLEKLAPVRTLFGWQTATMRDHLGLDKSKDKGEQSPQSHAVDGVALAASELWSTANITPATQGVLIGLAQSMSHRLNLSLFTAHPSVVVNFT